MDWEVVTIPRTPILIHADNVDEADALKKWRTDSKNASQKVPGDDRSPPWTWQTYLYHDGQHLTVPADNLMAGLSVAGSKIPMGKSNFRSTAMSGLFIPQEQIPILCDGKPIPLAAVHKFRDLPFAEHEKAVEKLGFKLSKKRAPVNGKGKHLRVRAMIEKWSLHFKVQVNDPGITPEIFTTLMEIFGHKIGILDWRPGSKKPGPWGTFDVNLKPAK